MKPTQNKRIPPASLRPAPGRKRRKKLTFRQALFAVLRDRVQGIQIKLNIDGESVVKAIICFITMVLLAMLQTTFFASFRPFGAIPDLMLSLTVAIAVMEGEKWGAVWGMTAAFFIECLGGVGIVLLPLLYMPAGFFCGILATYYLSDTFPVRLIYMGMCGVARAILTMIFAVFALNGATFPEILLDIVIPEFFSTMLLAPLIYGFVWLVLKPFHKTRAERTERKLKL